MYPSFYSPNLTRHAKLHKHVSKRILLINEYFGVYAVIQCMKAIKDNRKQLHGFEPGNDHPFLIFSMGWAVGHERWERK